MDKIAHFFGCAFLFLAIERFLGVLWAIIIVVLIGIAKEVLDVLEGAKIDFYDLLADGLGVLLAFLIMLISN